MDDCIRKARARIKRNAERALKEYKLGEVKSHTVEQLKRSYADRETREILANGSAVRTVKRSIRELDGGKGIPLEDW